MPRPSRRTQARANPLSSGLVRALVHEVGNLLAAARISGHFLGTELSAGERESMSRDAERLTSQAAALLGQIRPLTEGSADRRARVKVAALLRGLAEALEGAIADEQLRVATGRGLPEVRVDSDAIHKVLVGLVTAAVSESGDARVRVTARAEGSRVILAVIDELSAIDLPKQPALHALRSRELGVVLADAVLRNMGGRARLAPRRRGNQVELSLPAVRAPSPGVRRPRAGRGAPRRP